MGTDSAGGQTPQRNNEGEDNSKTSESLSGNSDEAMTFRRFARN